MERKRNEKTGRLAAILLAVAVCLLGSGCAEQVSAAEMDFSFSDRDLDPSYDEATATRITLEDGKTTVEGEGAEVSGDTVTLSEEGTYLISGSLSNGQIVVDADKSSKLQLVLLGADVRCENDAALLIKEADKVFLTLAEGTENALTDGALRETADGEESKIDGVIYSKADLTINGSGSLTVTGSYKHGIVSKDDLIITGGNISVTAEKQGLAGKDCVKIKDGTIVLNTGGDGIQSDNAEDETRGFVYVAGGTLQITASEGDGIQAETVLRIDGGTFDINTGGGSAQAPERVDEVMGRPGGGFGGGRGGFGEGQEPGAPPEQGERPEGGPADAGVTQGAIELPAAESAGDQETGSEESEASTKGLKAGKQLLVNGGTVTIDALDDALHSNGDLAVTGGEITAATGDDGLHADNNLTVSGGTILVTKSYEGLEAKTVTISGGTIDVTSDDDGLNASDGTGDQGMGGFPGGSSTQGNSDMYILISGGTINIDAGGDGIDSNGDVTVSGGTITVSGTENNGNSALDYEGKAEISGGVFMGTGSSGMAQGFSDTSTQRSVLYRLSESVEAGSTVTVTDEDGNTLLSWTAEKRFDCVQFSLPELKEGQTLTLKAGSVVQEITPDSVSYSNGGGRGMQGVPGEEPGAGRESGTRRGPGGTEREGKPADIQQ